MRYWCGVVSNGVWGYICICITCIYICNGIIGVYLYMYWGISVYVYVLSVYVLCVSDDSLIKFVVNKVSGDS